MKRMMFAGFLVVCVSVRQLNALPEEQSLIQAFLVMETEKDRDWNLEIAKEILGKPLLKDSTELVTRYWSCSDTIQTSLCMVVANIATKYAYKGEVLEISLQFLEGNESVEQFKDYIFDCSEEIILEKKGPERRFVKGFARCETYLTTYRIEEDKLKKLGQILKNLEEMPELAER